MRSCSKRGDSQPIELPLFGRIDRNPFEIVLRPGLGRPLFNHNFKVTDCNKSRICISDKLYVLVAKTSLLSRLSDAEPFSYRLSTYIDLCFLSDPRQFSLGKRC